MFDFGFAGRLDVLTRTNSIKYTMAKLSIHDKSSATLYISAAVVSRKKLEEDCGIT